MEPAELVLLGKIDGKIDGVRDHLGRQDKRLDDMEARHDKRFDDIDSRLRVVEQKAAVTGAVSGGAMSVGIALLIEGVKHWLNSGGVGR